MTDIPIHVKQFLVFMYMINCKEKHRCNMFLFEVILSKFMILCVLMCTRVRTCA